MSPITKKPRVRSEFDNQTRYRLVSQFLQPNGPTKQQLLAENPGLQKRTFNRWLRTKDKILEIGESGVRQGKKRNYAVDPLQKVKDQTLQFLEWNLQLEESSRLQITGELVGLKAKLIAQDLLNRQHQLALTDEEVEALQKFKGSDSWGRKFCKDYGHPLGTSRTNEDDDDNVAGVGATATTTTRAGPKTTGEEDSDDEEPEATMNLDNFRAGMDQDLAAKEEQVEEVLGFKAYHLYKGCFEELCDMAKTKRLKKILVRGLAMTRKVMVEEASREKKKKLQAKQNKKGATASLHNHNDNSNRASIEHVG